MPKFFCENIKINSYIDGETAHHLSKALRVRVGEEITVCDMSGTDYKCKITNIDSEKVYVDILSESECAAEPSVKVTLFQCLTKGDKMDDIVRHSVELGVSEIVPVLSSFCVSRPDEKQMKKKRERLQKIADSAAEQSGRGIKPTVGELITLKECAKRMSEFDRPLFFYECGGEPIKEIIFGNIKTAAVIIGSEGGFSPEEAELLKESGVITATLGKRILRAETAPLAALTAVMLLTDNLN